MTAARLTVASAEYLAAYDELLRLYVALGWSRLRERLIAEFKHPDTPVDRRAEIAALILAEPKDTA